MRIPVLVPALASQSEGVLDAAAASENIRVIGAGVALANDVRGHERQLLGQRGRAAPFDVLAAVGGALVGAAHHVNVVQRAQLLGRHAFELRDGRDAARGGLGAVAAEREGLHLGEEDGIVGRP